MHKTEANVNRKEKIYEYMKSAQYVPLKQDELKTVLDVPESDVVEFENILGELEREHRIIKTRRGRYMVSEKLGFVYGVYSGTGRGFGFVDAENGGIFIPKEKTGGAMHGDEVAVRITEKAADGKSASGEVVKVEKRANENLVCTFIKRYGKMRAVPDNKRIWQNIIISPAHTKNASNGQKVFVKITKYPKADGDAMGVIDEVLGYSDDPETLGRCVMKTYNLPEKFSSEVLLEAKQIASVPVDISGRRDLRDDLIITIDGEDARDLDDAVTVKRKGDNFLLGVHIADVSHYVKYKGKVHSEAVKRGTSVYLSGSVIPMLPQVLSNGICSLNPNEDRLTLSIDMEITPDGKIISHDIYKAVIKSKHRMTYSGVTEILENGGDGDELENMLKTMKILAEILRRRRMNEGSIDFDFPESKLIYDETGKVIDIYQYEYTISNIIIEEFMLAANRTVAEHYFHLEMPFVYRVHENPSDEKMAELMRVLTLFNQSIKGRSGEIHPGALAQVLENVKGKPYARIVGNIMLRSMMKARYDTQNLGHFGLAAKYYCHFTSPIRRLADLTIHEIISQDLNGTLKPDKMTKFAAIAAKSASDTEIIAEEAERMSKKLKTAEYMYNFVGMECQGVISSITSSAFYVELENLVEGRVALSDIDDDYYIYNEANLSLMGERKGKVYNIGDSIDIVIAAVDKSTGDIDFVPIL